MKRLCYIPIIILLSLTTSSCIKEELASHNFVDLGLPSGLLWASCNLGAMSPEDYGDYYAWAEVQPKSSYDWNNYIYGNEHQLTKYCLVFDHNTNSDYFSDNLTTLQPSDDAATVKLGKGFRTPTYAEWRELLDNTNAEMATVNNVYGLKLTSNNGNSIFLPAAGYWNGSSLYSVGLGGYYWSSSLSNDNLVAGYYGFGSNDGGYRCYGKSVRAVCQK